jgi:hypothetical protein
MELAVKKASTHSERFEGNFGTVHLLFNETSAHMQKCRHFIDSILF